MRVFVDTSALLALGNPSDGLHDAARRAFSALRRASLVTSDHVLDETLTCFLTTGRARPGLEFVDAVLRSPRYEVAFMDRTRFDRARVRAAKLAAHGLSFTDCTSVVLMEELKVGAIFAFDEGFRRVGLRVLPGA